MQLTNIIEIPIGDLVPAEWNYKAQGEEEAVTRLINSIEKDKSAGVPAVRVLPKGKYEVIDGNHRLTALQQLGWKNVICENFGKISKGTAITIARRRNHKWFEDDTAALGLLYRDFVVPEFGLDSLDLFMPEGADGIQNIIDVTELDWDKLQTDIDDNAGQGQMEGTKLVIAVDDELMAEWLLWKQKVSDESADDTNEEAFRIMLYYLRGLNLREGDDQ